MTRLDIRWYHHDDFDDWLWDKIVCFYFVEEDKKKISWNDIGSIHTTVTCSACWVLTWKIGIVIYNGNRNMFKSFMSTHVVLQCHCTALKLKIIWRRKNTGRKRIGDGLTLKTEHVHKCKKKDRSGVWVGRNSAINNVKNMEMKDKFCYLSGHTKSRFPVNSFINIYIYINGFESKTWVYNYKKCIFLLKINLHIIFACGERNK